MSEQKLIYTFTDFGSTGPYLGLMDAAVHKLITAQSIPLVTDAPVANPRLSAYLLAALLPYLPDRAVVLAVVDPGVGSARKPLAMHLDGRWVLGPDNGLLAIAARRAQCARAWEICIADEGRISASFHGRDLFAPTAAKLLQGMNNDLQPYPLEALVGWTWPQDIAQIIYIDHYGNAMTGMRVSSLSGFSGVQLGQRRLLRARTFSSVAPGEALCYENALGLVEIAINQGHAANDLGLRLGDEVGLL